MEYKMIKVARFRNAYKMPKVLWTATAVLLVQAAHGYILLTANIEDVQNVAHRLVQSPIGGQVSNIVRRAYNVFNNHLGKARANFRADDGEIIFGYNAENHPETPEYRRNNENSKDRNQTDDANTVPDQLDEKTEQNALTNEEDEKNTRRADDEFSALGKSAGVYLQKIKKIFENA